MARKLFLVIALFLLVGELTGELSEEDGIILSELYAPAAQLELADALVRDKRGIRSWFKRKWKKFKRLFKKPKPEPEAGDQGGGEQGGGGEEPQQEG